MMYKYNFHKIDPYDWFCGPRSHLFNEYIIIMIIAYNIFNKNTVFWPELLAVCRFSHPWQVKQTQSLP